MDNLKVSVKQISSTARVLSQLLSKFNKDLKDKNLIDATLHADKVFDAGRKLDKALKGYKSMYSISKKDFKNKLEDLFRQVFAFLDGVEMRMRKFEGEGLEEANKMLFLAKSEARDILQGITILTNVMRASEL